MCGVKKKLLFVFFIVLLAAGCATNQDLRRVQGHFEQRATVQADEIGLLKQENTTLRKEIEGYQEALAAVRKSLAENNAEMAELKDRQRQLGGLAEELRRDLIALQREQANQHRAASGREQEIREKLDKASFKINFLENFLGIGKREPAAEPADKGGRTANVRGRELQESKPDKETLYAAAFETFKEGKYEKARLEFENYLKLYPKTEYSGNAQFWLGECFYNEQQYEKAILEYEKVVREYPESNKVPAALFKQGLSFRNLGDKSSARLFLQQVIRDYPNTNQAKAARGVLMEIK